MERVVKDFLNEIGYTNIDNGEQETKVNEWLNIYKGKIKNHEYYVYNGKKKVKQILKSLNIASQSCGDLADFFFNEKLDLTFSDETIGNKIKEVLKANGFLYNSNKLMQLVKALGTGAYCVFKEKDVIKMNYLNAKNIIILSNDNKEVESILFYSTENRKDGEVLTINAHIFDGKQYIIYNREYLKDANGEYRKLDLGKELETIETKSVVPKFATIITPENNNIDINSPYGLSCYANAYDTLLSIDRAYDTYDNEVWLGRKRIYVKGGAVQFNTDSDGNITPIFDATDTTYYQIPGNDKDPMVKDETSTLRITEIKDALQGQLNLYTSKVGLGHNYYKFQNGEVYVNTDNVISANSDVYRKIKKQENIITEAITKVCYAIAELLGITTQFDVSVFYDDSIIEDTEQIRKQAQTEYNSKLISKAQYYRDVYKLGEKEAIEFATKMNEEIKNETVVEGEEETYME